MFKLIGKMIKWCFIIIAVLFLGNTLKWDGRTISDQIKMNVAHAERSDWLGTFQEWIKQVSTDARNGLKNIIHYGSKSENSKNLNSRPGKQIHLGKSDDDEEITVSERQKLKSLIRELNGTHPIK